MIVNCHIMAVTSQQYKEMEDRMVIVYSAYAIEDCTYGIGQPAT